MTHVPAIISDLAIILVTAGIVSLLFKKLKQPVVLGYLVAGLLVGPEINFIPTVRSSESIKHWAEIGVIFLLFSLGLEFSFKKLLTVSKSAFIVAIVEVISMIFLGYFLGKSFGWNHASSLFLGAILSISSTTIIIRAFDELGVKQFKFARIVFGVLVVEDLLAILILVALPTLAISESFQSLELINISLRLLFFLTLWFTAGIFVIPWIFRKFRKLFNNESYLIVSLGLCLSMVMLASQAGFSAAIGAFLMGSILAETPDGLKIEHLLHPVRDLFAAIFFVSVGMLIDIQSLHQYWDIIIIISILTIFSKIMSSALGSLLSGQNFRTSLQVSMSLGQIGEFSFIIATLGLSLNLISEFIYPVTVAVSVITTFFTPYLIKLSDPLFYWIESKYGDSPLLKLREGNTSQSRASKLKNGYAYAILRILLNTTIIIAIYLFSSGWLLKTIKLTVFLKPHAHHLSMIFAVIASLPFLWGIIVLPTEAVYKPENKQDFNYYINRASVALVCRTIFATVLIAFIIGHFTSAKTTLFLVTSIALAIAFLGFKNLKIIYNWLENKFVANLNEKEVAELESLKTKPVLAPWGMHLAEFTIAPNSEVIGKPLEQLAIREKTGFMIVMIERGDSHLLPPKVTDQLMPHDRIFAIGTDHQIGDFEKIIKATKAKQDVDITKQMELFDILVVEKFDQMTIKESNIRELVDGIVVGIERANQRILNPDSKTKLNINDRLWIVGNYHKKNILTQSGKLD